MTRPTVLVALGWCLAGQHDQCPTAVHLSDKDLRALCNCSCHGEENK